MHKIEYNFCATCQIEKPGSLSVHMDSEPGIFLGRRVLKSPKQRPNRTLRMISYLWKPIFLSLKPFDKGGEHEQQK